jgi:DNA-directed RNA polymerase subunit RPC12/RpoP
MNHWLQTKIYRCMRCGESYLHDKAYAHSVFLCLRRERTHETTARPSMRRREGPCRQEVGLS